MSLISNSNNKPFLFEITSSSANKDLKLFNGLRTRHQAREDYLEYHEFFDNPSFKTLMPSPVVERYEDKFVLRCDLAPAGFKAYAAEKFISSIKSDTLVYCAPRVGHAPEAIASLAEKYGKKCVFFAPASGQVSKHQAVVMAYGADLRFIKIAAMPTLNVYAKRWAQGNNAHFLAFGMSGIPQVTAGIVNLARNVSDILGGDPPEFYCATSTGTMIRGLQIGWPETKAHSIAVSRNIKEGERGEGNIISATIPFLKAVKELPPFPTTANYDAKAWDLFKTQGVKGSIFINVGADAQIEARYHEVDVSNVRSQREWGDLSALKY